jgi:preprotein translocase subunit SecG
VANYFNIAQIILSVALIAAIILQSKGAGLGGLTGGEAGGVFRTRRGLEKTLFNLTIILSAVFFAVALANVLITG